MNQPALPGLAGHGRGGSGRGGSGRGGARQGAPPVARGPVARVLLDTPLPHLAQPFDYLVPSGVAVVPGIRVQVRFAGRLTSGFVTEVVDTSEHAGELRPLHRVVSSLPVATPEVLQLARDVAAAYAGSVSDVLRLAIPPRQATVEQNAELVVAAIPAPACADDWARYIGGPAFLRHLENGSPVRAVWSALPGVAGAVPAWVEDLRAPVAATLRAGKRVLVIVPTTNEVELVTAALGELGSVTSYHGELKAAARYRAFLTILGGMAPITVGTRSAVFAPVPDLGLVVVWDPADDSLAERRAPYPHALGVALLRRKCALLVGSVSRSAASQQLVEDGVASPIGAPREVVRERAPLVHAPTPADLRGDTRRIPSAAFELLRVALQNGPVLVQVPRAGYLEAVRCAACGTRIRCQYCAGPLFIPPGGGAKCRWCDRPGQVACPECGATRLAAYGVGSERTVEELGRAFTGVPVTLSNARVGVTRRVGSEPRLVIATPGAEPVAQDGYLAALILDAGFATARPELEASGEALHRWMKALGLLRPASAGGKAMILGDADPLVLQACVSWDAPWWARRELAERAELRFPPTWRLARILGPAEALREVARDLPHRIECDMLGPSGEQLLARVPRDRGRTLAGALRDIQAERSAHRKEPIRVQIDPPDL